MQGSYTQSTLSSVIPSINPQPQTENPTTTTPEQKTEEQPKESMLTPIVPSIQQQTPAIEPQQVQQPTEQTTVPNIQIPQTNQPQEQVTAQVPIQVQVAQPPLEQVTQPISQPNVIEQQTAATPVANISTVVPPTPVNIVQPVQQQPQNLVIPMVKQN